jgi:beta-glucanase (GH16 family)
MSIRLARRLFLAALLGTGLALMLPGLPSSAEEKEKKADDDWKLVFSDTFDKPGLPDPEKWTYEEGYIRNNEKQYYTKERKENVRVEEGKLIIEARKEQFKIEGGARTKGKKTADYTSGSLTSKKAWTYGKIEVKAKIPTGKGMWPAIWMLGEGGWPGCGEIDIMENVGFDPDTIHTNMHTQKYNHTKKTNKGAKMTVAKPFEDFHVYAVEWHPDRIDSFVDGKKYFTFKNEGTGNDAWPFDRPEHLKLNIAIGGDWGGQKGLDNSIFPQKMEISYVKIYQLKKAGE